MWCQLGLVNVQGGKMWKRLKARTVRKGREANEAGEE